MRIHSGVEVAALTDVGCQREKNEDYYSYWEPASEQEFHLKGRLAVVADGMGGYAGGETASRMAVDTIIENYSQTKPGSPDAWLEAGFQAAHQQIIDYAKKNPGLHGMGTTCTAVALLGNHFHYAHVGDSRLYMLREGKLHRLTHDHSYVGRLLEKGVITSQQAEAHPQRHVLTAALGAGPSISPEHSERPLAIAPGDVLLLCTDGLWGLVSDDEIEEALKSPPANASATLVQMAKARGGPDNITVQVLAISP